MLTTRGSALLEFALVWPVVLVATLVAVQLGIWSASAFAARSAALAAAHAGAVAGGSPGAALSVATPVLAAASPGSPISGWCPPGRPPAGLWVCARDGASAFEVVVGGSLPALVPLLPAHGLAVHADATAPHERFQ